MIRGSIPSGQVDAIRQVLNRVESGAMDLVYAAVEREAINLVRYVKSQKLHGQVLNIKTNRLNSSIVHKMSQDGETVTAVVGTNVKYARFWELGFDRKVGAGARGGPRSITGKALITYFAKHPPAMKNFPARPFLQPSLEENRDRIVSNVFRALKAAARQGK